MELRALVEKNRSYRRFYEECGLDREVLLELVDLARLAASGGNKQPLKYLLVHNAEDKEKLFPLLKWAAYLRDWDGPAVGERPGAYIIMLLDKEISKNTLWEPGFAAENILLGAVAKGLGGCVLASINKQAIAESFAIDERFAVLMVIALGKPRETVVLEEMDNSGSVRYYRDEAGRHHVPKRKLADLVLKATPRVNGPAAFFTPRPGRGFL